ncbi:gas vesicle protein [Chryseobacterium sp. H1D6B]|uniref:RebB family R body protein n=1 Tax=Chryseobacterium sp. H1D6B TaxID=2940588 RepID=UPI001850B880|nr:RebB family R body protein [Chryseobacterium sp. H1D6B]MDH6254169.1 gas vesicle protein [Chryseobacterium sp. H1D6B]
MIQYETLTPEEILAYNEAFVMSLSALNQVIHQQRTEIIDEALRITEAISQRSPEQQERYEESINKLKSLSQTKTDAAAPEITPSSPAATDADEWTTKNPIYDSLVHALQIAYENAVNSQNQCNILGQAALTQGIMNLYEDRCLKGDTEGVINAKE